MCDDHRYGEPTVEVMDVGRRTAAVSRRAFLRAAGAAGALWAGAGAGAAAFGIGSLPVAAQERKITVLTCMDYRINPLTFGEIGVDMSRAYIVRNAGGRVDSGAIRSIIVTQQKLGTKELFVVQHTDCGMATFKGDDFNTELSELYGVESTIDFYTFGDLEESVRGDVAVLRTHPFIPRTIPITGFVYDVGVGRLVEVTRM